MKRDIFDRAFSGVLPHSLRPPTDLRANSSISRDNSGMKRVHSGTTVLAIFYDQGILFAGDRKTSYGFSIVDQDKVKLYQISEYSGCAAAGQVSDIQMIVRSLEQVNGAFMSQYDYPLTVEGQVNYVVNHLRYYWQYSFSPMNISMFLGGFNPKKNNFQLFEIGYDGFRRECFDYVVVGSGTDFAVSRLEENRRKLIEKRLSKEEAMIVATRAIFTAGKKDLGTSDIRVAVPSVAIIDQSGFSLVEEETIKRISVDIIKEEI